MTQYQSNKVNLPTQDEILASNEIPDNIKTIFQISNRNRKKNKQRKKEVENASEKLQVCQIIRNQYRIDDCDGKDFKDV